MDHSFEVVNSFLLTENMEVSETTEKKMSYFCLKTYIAEKSLLFEKPEVQNSKEFWHGLIHSRLCSLFHRQILW